MWSRSGLAPPLCGGGAHLHFVSPTTLGGGGGRGHLYRPQCFPLPWVKVGEGLICVIHSVSPSTLVGVGGGGAHLQYPQCLLLGGGGAYLHHSQCHSLYLRWR